MQRHDDPFLPFGKAIIDATHDLCCAYVFDLAAYLSLGASGAIALERTIAYVPAPLIKILDGPFTRAEYVRVASESAFAVDAVTLATLDSTVLIPLLQADRGVFIKVTYPLMINPVHLGVVGTYHPASDHFVFTLYSDPPLQMRCYTDTITLASRADDFREAARSAAERLRNLV